MATKKSFKNENPALRFISPASERAETKDSAGPAQERQRPAPAAEEAGRPLSGAPMKKNPLYVETRSRRLNLLIQPSLHKRIKALADARQTSLNDLVHMILEKYAEREEG